MEKHLLSCAILHHLKPRKCIINNLKPSCSFSSKADICSHICGSNGHSVRHTECSSKDANTQIFPKFSHMNHRTIQYMSSSRKESNEMTKHNCNSSQQGLISFDTSSKRDRVSAERVHRNASFQSYVKQNLLKQFKNLKRKCIGNLVRKAYLNMRDNQLLSDQRRNDVITRTRNDPLRTFLESHDTFSLPDQDINFGHFGSNFQSGIFKQSSEILDSEDESKISTSPSISVRGHSDATSNPSIKELFQCKMYKKYQYPTSQEALKLSALFPEPKKLLSAVVKTMMRVDDNYASHLEVTEHLCGSYWKAQLTMPCPHRVSFYGIHPDRDRAIHGAYLVICEHLKKMGWIFQNKDGSWQPMTCEKVMVMLERLSRYGESSLGCSRGKGFKIVLKQAKEGKSFTKENVDDVHRNMNGEKNSCEHKSSVVNCLRKVKDTGYSTDSVTGNENVWIDENVKNTGLLASVRSGNTIHGFSAQHKEMKCIDVECSTHSPSVKRKIRPRWICTIHVGWPYPFSIQAEGVSLPAAQFMGYMLAVNKLKVKGLLTSCNSSIASESIEQLIIVLTQNHFQRNIKLMTDKTAIEQFCADAEIFCDASTKGFGAFLSLEGTEKVSWLSEEWEDHEWNSHHFLDSNHPQRLHSMAAELFAVVTAVFTWKHKLRSRRLLCSSDNVVVMGFINSYISEPLSSDICTSPLEYLIHTLQTTCLEYSIKLQATWLDRQENWLADRLSRNDIDSFQAAVPEASAQKTKAKKIKIREGAFV